MSITFTTDGSTEYDGFHLVYTSIPGKLIILFHFVEKRENAGNCVTSELNQFLCNKHKCTAYEMWTIAAIVSLNNSGRISIQTEIQTSGIDHFVLEISTFEQLGLLFKPKRHSLRFRCNRQTYSPTRHYTHGYRFAMKL